MATLIRGGTVVTADQSYRADVLCDQGLIKHRFVVAMHDRFRTDGIELVSTAPPKPVPPPTAPPAA